MLTAQSALQSSPESSDDSKSSGSAELNELNNNDTSKWNAADLDFFDPFYDDKFANIDDAMKHINKNTYFRDVHLFIERARNVIIIKNAELVRENLWICLRKTALALWIDETSIAEKRLARYFIVDDQLNE